MAEETPYQIKFDGSEEAEAALDPAKSGKATATFSNGDKFEGDYSNGKREGKGTYTWAAPKPAEGEEEEGEAKAGSQYKGEYKGGLKNGNGAATYADGGEYRGGWKDGKKSGQGVYYYPNGDSYVGEWADGQRQGKGTYSFAACKSQYVGVWKAGAMTSGVWVRHDQSKVQINA